MIYEEVNGIYYYDGKKVYLKNGVKVKQA